MQSQVNAVTSWYMQLDVMQQGTLNNVASSLNTKFYFYLETSGGQNSNLYLSVIYFYNTSDN